MLKQQTKIAFIGGGNMAKAMVAGFLKAGVAAQNILVCAPSEQTRLRIVEEFGVNVAAKNAYAVHFADIIFLAVKPKLTKTVCSELNMQLRASGEQKLVVSMAAGMTLGYLRNHLDDSNNIAVIMPNLPTAHGAGVIGVTMDQQADNHARLLLSEYIGLLGLVFWLEDQEQMHNIVAAAGSAPAYIFLFLEAMVESAHKLGLSNKEASDAVMQTGIGAMKMALESRADFRKLRKLVTSPNGTTEQAINEFEANNLKQIVHDAMSSVCQQSKLIGQSI